MKAYLRTRKSAQCYYCLLKWKESGVWRSRELSTNIPIDGNNKRRAQRRCEELRAEYEEKYEHCEISQSRDMLFADYMKQWLEGHRHSLKASTYYGYSNIINKHINPYFTQLRVRLIDLTPMHIQNYYNSLLDKGIPPIQSSGIMQISVRRCKTRLNLILYHITRQTERICRRQRNSVLLYTMKLF